MFKVPEEKCWDEPVEKCWTEPHQKCWKKPKQTCGHVNVKVMQWIEMRGVCNNFEVDVAKFLNIIKRAFQNPCLLTESFQFE